MEETVDEAREETGHQRLRQQPPRLTALGETKDASLTSSTNNRPRNLLLSAWFVVSNVVISECSSDPFLHFHYA